MKGEQQDRADERVEKQTALSKASFVELLNQLLITSLIQSANVFSMTIEI